MSRNHHISRSGRHCKPTWQLEEALSGEDDDGDHVEEQRGRRSRSGRKHSAAPVDSDGDTDQVANSRPARPARQRKRIKSQTRTAPDGERPCHALVAAAALDESSPGSTLMFRAVLTTYLFVQMAMRQSLKYTAKMNGSWRVQSTD